MILEQLSSGAYLLIALAAFGLMVLSCLIALKAFPKWGLLDQPQKYGLKRKPIPYPGGVLLYFCFLILVLILFDPGAKLIALLAGGGVLALVSFIDDRIGVHPLLRLLVQAFVALILVFGGIGIEGITNPLGGYIDFSAYLIHIQWGSFQSTIMLLSALFTVFWILLLVNTMNWLDGIPGLTSGISAIGCLILFFLSISPIVNQPDVATLALIMSMLSLGFWLFDFHPAKMIIGDSGSMFLGLMIATLAIFSDGKIATAFLVLGFPILDAMYVTIYRLYHKKAPWKGGEWDRERKAVHLHHRLLQRGLSERRVLLLIYLLSATFGMIALFLGTRGKFWAIVFLSGVSVAIGMLLKVKRRSGK